MKNSFLSEMRSRGYLNQCTDLENLEKISKDKSIKAYIGFDCTAPSLHVGSLLQIMLLRLMQRHGHQPIVLLGGGTTLIGDPSGKDSTRKILKQKDIKKNILSIKKLFEKLLPAKNKKIKPIFVDNYQWLSKLKYIDFLREIGKHFTINKMLSFDSVKLRLDREQSLSYMEFNYMILQAYDFLELNKTKNCMLQIGGSDQWGNIVNGVDLIKRYSSKSVYGLTTPLITLASGAKMGKTEKGAIWLDKKLLSSFDYWQFWRNTDDRDVIKFLKMFTDIQIEKIHKIKNSDINDLKILLANSATELLHGKKLSDKAESTAKNIFVKGLVGDQLPTVKLSKSNFESNLNIIELVFKSKLLTSKNEIRRMIKNKGIKINNKTIEDEKFAISKQNFNEEKILKLSIGKKKHVVFKLS